MLKTHVKKSASLFNFRDKSPKHLWDTVAEQSKVNRIETTKKAEKKGTQLIKIIVTPQDLSEEEESDNDLHIVDDREGPDEGFFPCPFCTCWFTHKRDLDFHVKKWCDRAKANLVFFTETK